MARHRVSRYTYVYLIETPGVFARESIKNRKSVEVHNQIYQWLDENSLSLKLVRVL